MPADRSLVLQKIALLRRAVIVELEHAEILRAGVEDDDTRAIARGLRGMSNARELVVELLAEIVKEIGPDFCISRRTSPDGYLGAVEL